MTCLFRQQTTLEEKIQGIEAKLNSIEVTDPQHAELAKSLEQLRQELAEAEKCHNLTATSAEQYELFACERVGIPYNHWS